MWDLIRAFLIDNAGFDNGSVAVLAREQNLNGLDAGI